MRTDERMCGRARGGQARSFINRPSTPRAAAKAAGARRGPSPPQQPRGQNRVLHAAVFAEGHHVAEQGQRPHDVGRDDVAPALHEDAAGRPRLKEGGQGCCIPDIWEALGGSDLEPPS